jgi:predicted HAD superfamily hydrolase
MQHFPSLDQSPVMHFGKAEKALRDAESFEKFYNGPMSDALLDRILKQSERVKVVSFDIFDTVLWRDSRSELERFADIAARFIEKAGPAAVPDQRACLVARITCALNAYQLSEIIDQTTEGRLRDIALNIMHTLRVSGDRRQLAELWCQAELEVESEQLRIAPFIDDLINRLTAMDKQIIFLSDMYLQADQIGILLERAGVDMNRVARLISTADERVNKRSGTIFPRLTAQMDMFASDFLHMGDSFTSDFRKPLEAGWSARHLPVPQKVLAERRESHFQTCEAFFGRRRIALPIAAPTI